jgi:hypothetical protein
LENFARRRRRGSERIRQSDARAQDDSQRQNGDLQQFAHLP